MQLLDTLDIPSAGGIRRIELLAGDLSDIPVEHAVDALAVSAFRGNYVPVPGTLIAALDRRGLAVDELARDKEFDLLDVSGCWLSRSIDKPDLNFRRLLCIEPSTQKEAPDAVGDVFRSLIPYVTGEPWISRVALPLLSSGNQGFDPMAMLRAILDAAIHWLSTGLPLDVMKIVVFEGSPPALIAQALQVFRSYSAEVDRLSDEQQVAPDVHDLFVSYSHKDSAAVETLVAKVKALAPDMRVYIDRAQLDVGSAWQREIFEAIDASRRIVCLYSPDYLASKVCQEEYHIAYLRNRENPGVLTPAYLRTTRLPSFMKLVQYHDVRECDSARLDDLAHRLVGKATGDDKPAPVHPAHEAAARISISADTSAETIIDLLNGKEIRLDVRIRAVDTSVD